jgi:pilus retraction protein PilT
MSANLDNENQDENAGGDERQVMLNTKPLFKLMVEKRASDLFFTSYAPVKIKIEGNIYPVNKQMLTPEVVRQAAYGLMTQDQIEAFNEELEVDFAVSEPGLGRFRVNVFYQRGNPAMVLRYITADMPRIDDLGLPDILKDIVMQKRGLVLMVGATGSGKSTTLAAMIDRINETKPLHILTIEDPVEYLHHHKMAMVNQREVGTDAISFEQGLRSALREDPDVILLGEMRDLESIQIALSLAETGHLVFATLHTNDASQALDRMVDVFPAEKRDQIQTMLAGSLQGVISQRLLPATSGGRVAAYEVLIGTEAVRNLVREGKSRQLRNVVSTGGPDGMQTIEMDMARLVTSGLVTMEMAQAVSAYPAEIQAQVSTLRAQAQAQATQASGQVATSGSGQRAGEDTHTPEPANVG